MKTLNTQSVGHSAWKFYSLIFFSSLYFNASIAQASNDNFCDAITLSIDAPCDEANGDLTNTTLETNEALGSCFNGLPATASVWYQFTAPENGLVVISANFPDVGTVGDLQMALFELNGTDCVIDSLVELTCNDSEIANGGIEPLPTINAELAGGQTYYIQVAEQAFEELATGTFCIQVTSVTAPINDEICDAIALELDSEPVEFSNIGATSDAEFALAPPSSFTDFFGFSSWGFNLEISHSIWFSFVAPETGTVEIDALSFDVIGNFNAKMAVYEANSCEEVSGMNLIAAQSTFNLRAESSVISTLVFQNKMSQLSCLTPGQTYYILIDGIDNVFGSPTNETGRGKIAVNTIDLTEPALSLKVEDATVFPAGCAGDSFGAINFSPTGGAISNDAADGFGSPSYAYQWSHSEEAASAFVEGLAEGVYEVTVTDLCGTEIVKSFEITTFAPPIVEVSGDTLVAPGEPVQLFNYATGGVPYDEERLFFSYPNQDMAGNGFVSAMNLYTYEPPTTYSDGTTLPAYSTIAFGEEDMVYGVESNFSSAPQGILHKFNIATSESSLVDTLRVLNEGESIRDIQYNPETGDLLALYTLFDENIGGDILNIYAIDTETAATTFIQSFELGPFQGSADFIILEERKILLKNGSSELSSLDLYEVNLDTGEISLFESIPTIAPSSTNIVFDVASNDLIISKIDFTKGVSLLYRYNLDYRILEPLRAFPLDEFNFSDFTFSPRTIEAYDYLWTSPSKLDNPFSPTPTARVSELTAFASVAIDACGEGADGFAVVDIDNSGEGADLELSLATMSDSYETFQTLTYRISLTNFGPEAATNVEVEAKVPSNQPYTTHEITNGVYRPYTGIWSIGTLESGATATLDLTLFPMTRSGDISYFTQVIASDVVDPDSTPDNNISGIAAEDDEAGIVLSNQTGLLGISPVLSTYSLYPVPAMDELTLSFESLSDVDAVLSVVDMKAQVVFTKRILINQGYNQNELDITKLPAGNYTIKIEGMHQAFPFAKVSN